MIELLITILAAPIAMAAVVLLFYTFRRRDPQPWRYNEDYGIYRVLFKEEAKDK